MAKAEKRRHSKGYILVYMPRHPWAQKSGYVAEHRIIMEQTLGRFLLPLETVHHKNGVKDDNRAENLEVWYSGQPAGQRPEDLVAWALEILATYPEQVTEVAWRQRWMLGFRGTDRNEEDTVAKDDDDVTMRQRLEDEREINRLRALQRAADLAEEKRRKQDELEQAREAKRQEELQRAIDRAAEEGKKNR